MKQVPTIIFLIFVLISAGFLVSGYWQAFLLFLVVCGAGLLVFAWALARFALDRKARLNLVNYFDYETEHRSPDFTAAAQRFNEGRREWEMTSRDGLRLKAGCHSGNPDSHNWVILCHGYGNDASDGMALYALPYMEAGWHVLAPLARAHGESEGRYIGMGWPERLDICDWIAEIRKRDPHASVVLHGVSMGGAMVLNAAGEQPKGLQAVVADCGFTGIRQEFAVQSRALFGLPEFPVLNLASLFAGKWIGTSLAKTDTRQQTAKIHVPVLFVHGERDEFVPFSMLEENFRACQSPKTKLIVASAAHANSICKDPAYGKKVLAFLERIQQGRDVNGMYDS